MEFDTRVKTAIYRRVVETARAPGVAEIAAALAAPPEEIRGAYRRLFARRVLFLEGDGETIRMAPPFSGVPTQHRVRVGDRTYFANCSWRLRASTSSSGERSIGSSGGASTISISSALLMKEIGTASVLRLPVIAST